MVYSDSGRSSNTGERKFRKKHSVPTFARINTELGKPLRFQTDGSRLTQESQQARRRCQKSSYFTASNPHRLKQQSPPGLTPGGLFLLKPQAQARSIGFVSCITRPMPYPPMRRSLPPVPWLFFLKNRAQHPADKVNQKSYT